MKKRIYRAIWLLFYIPIFLFEVLLCLLIMIFSPLFYAYYFIKDSRDFNPGDFGDLINNTDINYRSIIK